MVPIAPCLCPESLEEGINSKAGDMQMEFTTLTFDQIALAAMACIALREAMIVFLPDDIAGPGGSLIDTGEEEV